MVYNNSMNKSPEESIFIEVSPRNIGTNSALIADSEERGEILSVESLFQQSISSIRNFSFEKSQPSSLIMKQYLVLARNYLNELREKCNLDFLKDSPKVLFFNTDDYCELRSKITGHWVSSKLNTTGAFVAYPLPEVFVLVDEDIPDYIMASLGVHELIHRWIDTHVVVYSRREKILKKIRVSSRRSGLDLDKNRGEFINELGNMVWQRNYIVHLLEQDEFEEQKNQRMEQLKSFGVDEDSLYLFITLQNGDLLRFDMKNIYLDNSGDLLLSSKAIPFVMSQLVDDLSAVLGKIDGEVLEVLLLKAKINLKLQNKIKKAIDLSFGRGFFNRLKKASYELKTSMELLKEVQKIRFGDNL